LLSKINDILTISFRVIKIIKHNISFNSVLASVVPIRAISFWNTKMTAIPTSKLSKFIVLNNLWVVKL